MHCILQRNLESMDLGVLQELHCKCNGKSIATRYIGSIVDSNSSQLQAFVLLLSVIVIF